MVEDEKQEMMREHERHARSYKEALRITETVYERKRKLAQDPNYTASEEAEAEYRKCAEAMKRAEQQYKESDRDFPDIYQMANLAAL